MGLDSEKLRIAGYVVAAVVAVLLGVRLLGGGGGSGGAPVSVDPVPHAPVAAPRSGGAGARVMVQVAGEVRRPGVYELPAGARVEQAVERAGGLTRRADQVGVNLVARVQDGQQVIVPRRGGGGAVAASGAGSAGTGAGTGASGAPAGPIRLSSATAEQLESLDGIGPTLAQRIVEYRQAHGGFRSVDELRQVSGIGEKRFAALSKAVVP